MKIYKTKRLAFTMIELIFAIVLIGVTMLTIPMVMRVNAGNQEDSLMQEGIILTTTAVSQAISYQWDPNSSPDLTANLRSTAQILDTASPAALLQRVVGTDFRVGHIQEKLRRRMTPPAPNNRTASTIGAGADSISSLHNTSENIGVAANATGYKKQWTVTTTVSYVSDNAAYAGNVINFDLGTASLLTSSIKMVKVIATDNTPGAVSDGVELTSFASNIGEAEFYKRRY